MTSPKLEILARQMRRHSQPERVPAPESGLGAAIEQLVQQAVQEQVADAIEQRKPPARVQRLLDQFDKPAPVTDFKQLPVVAKTAPPKNLSAQILRDGAGLVRWVQIGDRKFEAIRDGAGVLIGMKQVEESPVLPPPDIAVKSEARQYRAPAPRGE
ncbi:hypothetical protein [Pseudomonas silesiensis]